MISEGSSSTPLSTIRRSSTRLSNECSTPASTRLSAAKSEGRNGKSTSGMRAPRDGRSSLESRVAAFSLLTSWDSQRARVPTAASTNAMELEYCFLTVASNSGASDPSAADGATPSSSVRWSGDSPAKTRSASKLAASSSEKAGMRRKRRLSLPLALRHTVSASISGSLVTRASVATCLLAK